LEKEKFLSVGAYADVYQFDGSEASAKGNKTGDFEEAVRSSGLFATRKAIVLKRTMAFDAASADRLAAFLENNGPSILADKDTLLLIWDEKPDRRTKLFKTIVRICGKEAREYPMLLGNDLDRWIDRRVGDDALRIERPAKMRLIEMTGGSVARIDNELMKLANICQDGVIREIDVENITSSSFQTSVFQLLDAVGSGDRKSAIKMLHEQLARGADPLYLLSMYAYHLRNMVRVGSFVTARMTEPAIVSKALKLHPFVVGKLLRQLQVFRPDRAQKAFRAVARLDVAVKTGKIDGGLALAELLVKM
jgi:DNA polymerase III delta subunit